MEQKKVLGMRRDAAIAPQARLRDMLGALRLGGKGLGFGFLTQALSSLVIISVFVQVQATKCEGVVSFLGGSWLPSVN